MIATMFIFVLVMLFMRSDEAEWHVPVVPIMAGVTAYLAAGWSLRFVGVAPIVVIVPAVTVGMTVALVTGRK